jgi:[acyl-carrier-protein] S-malonyltransferase
MKDTEGRWLRRKSAIEVDASRSTPPSPAERRVTGGPTHSSKVESASGLRQRIRSTAFAFRGFDVENVGRSAELLDHPVYGPIVGRVLAEASELCSESIHAKVDLEAHIRAGARTSLDFFPQDVATIVATELAQMTMLEECFDVPARDARLAFGYSIGELSALVWSAVFSLEQLLPVPLGLAPDCAELAADLTMGVLFTRGPALPMDEVERLCRGISSEGHGLIGPSAFLSPNTALILGQGDTIDRLDAAKGILQTHKLHKVSLRRNANRWPPLHSPLVWQRHIPDRTAMALYKVGGGRTRPTPTLLSCVTGSASYNVENTRELLTDWTDHPQRLWDVIDRTLAMGVETVVHVGPRPNLIPATFTRLGNNVKALLGNKYMQLLGRGVANGLGRHSWLNRVLPSSTSLLRAPFLNHVILEDWLLEQPLPSVQVSMAGTSEISAATSTPLGPLP